MRHASRVLHPRTNGPQSPMRFPPRPQMFSYAILYSIMFHTSIQQHATSASFYRIQPILFSCFHLASALAPPQIEQRSANLSLSSVCTESPLWIGELGYVASDCTQAIQSLIHEEVIVHKDAEFEFVSPRTSPPQSMNTMITPRRYTVGSSPAYNVLSHHAN